MSVSARWRAQPLWRFAACSAPRFRPATNSQKSSVQVYLLCKISLYRRLLRKETCSHPSPFKCIAARFFIASTLPSSAASCTVIQSHTHRNTHTPCRSANRVLGYVEEERETEAPRTILPSKSIRNENRKSFVGEHECAHTRTDNSLSLCLSVLPTIHTRRTPGRLSRHRTSARTHRGRVKETYYRGKRDLL